MSDYVSFNPVLLTKLYLESAFTIEQLSEMYDVDAEELLKTINAQTKSSKKRPTR